MPSNLNLDYYYGTEADQYSFYRIPKTLLTDPRYKRVSIEAKVLYGLLLDRCKQSSKKGQISPQSIPVLGRGFATKYTSGKS
jgi:hypothetical protein